MAEYIEREALKSKLKNMEATSPNKVYQNAMEDMIYYFIPKIIDEIPSADVAPVRHAKWELIDECINEGVYCSNCHKKIYRARAEYANQKVKSNYCPNCGAKMDGDPYA